MCGCLPFGKREGQNDRSDETRDIIANNINYHRRVWGPSAAAADHSWVSTLSDKSRQQKSEYCNNTVTNSKYNVFTFIPLNLWEQFHRPINLYFLIVAALQFISIIAPVSPLSTLLPLLGAFALTAIKEGYDDWHRHKADRKDNERLYSILYASTESSNNNNNLLHLHASSPTGSHKGSEQSLAHKFETFPLREFLKDTRSCDIHVGDLILLREGDTVPCDVVALLSLSNEEMGEEEVEGQPEGIVYVSTENLDGENDAKPKQCSLSGHFYQFQMGQSESEQLQPVQLQGESSVLALPDQSDYELSQDILAQMVEYICGTSKQGDSVQTTHPAMASATLHCEGPNTFMKQFNGKISFQNDVRNSTTTSAVNNAPISLDINNLILASSVLHNTPYLIGMVVYTGHETKVGMTKKFPPLKWARLDQQTSSYSKRVFVFQFVIVLICTILGSVLNVRAQNRSWYLAYADEGGPMVANSSDDLNNWVFFVFILPLRFFLLLTVMVPISFKVMVDLSKYYLARTITWDLGLYYDPAEEPDSDIEEGAVPPPAAGSNATPADVCAVVNNSTLAEDLGQIQYVMTDKTGTLTRNKMSLRFVEVVGDPSAALHLHVYQKGDKACHSDRADWKASLHRQPFAELGQKLSRSGFENHLRMLEILSLCNTIEKPPPAAGSGGGYTSLRFGASSRKGDNTHRRIPKVHWSSPSPDETALVKGAAFCGATILDRRRKDSVVAFGGRQSGGAVTVFNPHTESSWSFTKEDIINYDILCVLPFSSDRGRMSVLVRNTTSQAIHLLTKGADERVMPLATNTPSAVHELLGRRLVMYSNRGLRTLVFASKEVEESEANEWLKMYQSAATADGEIARKKSLSAAYDAIEQGLTLVGVTAVEDKLQTGVPATIAILREAGIRVWMLTGDKTETAKQIGLACRLTLPSDDVLDLTFDPQQVPAGLSFADHMAAKLTHAYSKLRDGSSAQDFGREMIPTLCCLNSVTAGTGSDTPLISGEPFPRDDMTPRPCWVRAWRNVVGAFTCSYSSKVPIMEVLNPTATLATVVRGEPHTFTHKETEGDYLSTTAPPALTTPTSPCDYQRNKGQSIIVNSGAMTILQQNPNLLATFRPVLLAASTVICSRVTPDQKSLIVRIVKDAGKMTLAIGDGGNDVAMIQEAHVGVGITGYEGKQAAKAADFSFGQFRFLSRLLLVHGHMAYQRTAYIVQYSFYKSMIIAFIQVLFNFYTMMSGVSFWNSLALTAYNGVFTVPLTLFYVMDIHAMPKEGLLKSPYLYSLSQTGRYLNGFTFFYYVFRGVVQAIIAFFVTKFIFLDSHFIANNGFPMDNLNNSIPAYGALVFVQVLTVLCESHSVTWLHWVSFIFSFASYLLVFIVYSQIESMDFYKQFDFTCQYLVFYLGFLLTVVMVFGFGYAFVYPFIYNYFPSVLQLHRRYAPTTSSASYSQTVAPSGMRGSPAIAQTRAAVPADVKCPLIPSSANPRGTPPPPTEDDDPKHGSDFTSFLRSFRPQL